MNQFPCLDMDACDLQKMLLVLLYFSKLRVFVPVALIVATPAAVIVIFQEEFAESLVSVRR